MKNTIESAVKFYKEYEAIGFAKIMVDYAEQYTKDATKELYRKSAVSGIFYIGMVAGTSLTGLFLLILSWII